MGTTIEADDGSLWPHLQVVIMKFLSILTWTNSTGAEHKWTHDTQVHNKEPG